MTTQSNTDDHEKILEGIELQRRGDLVHADKLFTSLYNSGCRDINLLWRLGLLHWQLWKDFDAAYTLLTMSIGMEPTFEPPKKVLYDICREMECAVDEHDAMLRRLRADGRRPDWVVDLGAHKGAWTKKAAAHFPDARYLLIEADAELEEKLRAAVADLPVKADVVFAVAAEKSQESRDFYLNGLGSSVFVENGAIFDYARKVTLPTVALAELFRARGVDGEIFLKIDVQGAELEALRGVGDMLDQVIGLVCEVNVAHTYEGAPLADEVTAFLVERGFRLYDVIEPKRDPEGRLTQIDVVYVRPPAA